MSALPFVRVGPETPVAWQKGRPIHLAAFLHDLYRLAEELPEAAYMLNLCDDRYHFLLGLGAALLRRQVCLLPANRVPHTLDQCAATYPDLSVLHDGDEAWSGLRSHCVETGSGHGAPLREQPCFPPEQHAVTIFTSGTTGQPQPNVKTWGSLVGGALLAARRFELDKAVGRVIGTVPPQHMYGLETTIMLPLQAGWSVDAGRPFFPADILDALQACPGDTLLVSTPLHLKTCVESALAWPSPRFLLSATAPMPPGLAKQVEAVFQAPLFEIYGFTEAGSVASRRSIQGPLWQCYEGIRLRPRGEEMLVEGGHLPQAVPLNDFVDLPNPDRFILRGRRSDLINIAGKRISLGELNQQLNEIDGVRDGVFFLPNGEEGTRLAAFVVAPSMAAETLLTALRQRLDPVFLPRPLYFVDALPRTDTGKLPRDHLRALQQELDAQKQRGSA